MCLCHISRPILTMGGQHQWRRQGGGQPGRNFTIARLIQRKPANIDTNDNIL